MGPLDRDIVFLTLQWLKEQNCMETLHKLEKESGVFFNISYFEECVTNGEWEEVENYLSGFTKFDDNAYSRKILFEIHKQKYFEALDGHDGAKAVQILQKDLKMLLDLNDDLFQKLTRLLTLSNFRENEELSMYGDTKAGRALLSAELKRLIGLNPVFRDKLQFPVLNGSRLLNLTTQSLYWQHRFCENPKPNIPATLLVDHSCDRPIGDLATALTINMPTVGGLPPVGAHDPFQFAPASFNASIGGRVINSTQTPPPTISRGSLGLAPPHMPESMLKPTWTDTTDNLGLGYQQADPEHVLKRSKTIGTSKEGPMITAFGSSSLALGSNISAPIIVNEPDVKSGIPEDLDKSKTWKLTQINKPCQLRSLKLPDSFVSVRIVKLMYSNSGGEVLALGFNAIHKVWKWKSTEQNTAGKAITTVPPQLLQPPSRILMINDTSEINLEEAVPCFALTKNDAYLMSASGEKISLFNMRTFKTLATFMTPPPAATSLSFQPEDNNIAAIGMEDSSIQIYNVKQDKVIRKLKGHRRKVTGLAFSSVLNILVSSGADTRICVWNTDGWKKKGSNSLWIPSGREPNHSAPTRVQFHNDQTHMLVVHETQLAIYDASKLECINQWVFPLDTCGAITDATYSCDSQSIYASFEDGSVCVFIALPIRLRCRIYSTSYVPSNPRVHALAIAANPQEPNQFALGLTNGGVLVMEPLESEGAWGTAPPN